MAGVERNAHAAGAEANRLRAQIDAGKTGDKVAHSDPAAAPLGTDDEAADVPPVPGAVAASAAEETDRPTKAGESSAPAFLMIGTIVVAGLAVIGALLLR